MTDPLGARASRPPDGAWTWRRHSPYSLRARDMAAGGSPDGHPPYAVSRETVLEIDSGELAPRYSAWHGVPLEPGRRDIPMPTLLGVYRTPDEAKAACVAHFRRSGAPAAMTQAAGQAGETPAPPPALPGGA